jgi:hypothetical protein
MELEKIVEQKLKEIIDSGFVENKIKEQLESTVKSIITDCLRDYSDFGKKLKEKIKKSLSLGNMDLSLPEYNQLILNWVTDIVNSTMISSAKEKIEKNLKQFFKPLKKNEYKISEIIEEFKSYIDKEEHKKITFIRSNDDFSCIKGYISYYFDEEENNYKYSCDYMIGINKEGVWNVTIKDEDLSKIKTPLFFQFDSFLFQLYSCKVKIIDDYEDVNEYLDTDY